MNRLLLVAAIGALTTFWIVAGCGRAPEARSVADSPEALLEKFVGCVESLDSNGIVTCFDVSTDPGRRIADLLVAAFRAVRSQVAFEDAVREKYGEAFARERLGVGGGGSTVLLERVREVASRARIRLEGNTAKVEFLGPDGMIQAGPPAVMSRAGDGRWVFGVAPYLPDDPNLCAHLVHILGTFRTRHDNGIQALKQTATPEAFLDAMKPIDLQASTAARESMVVVEPFMDRYR